jgi:DNA-binding NtrC family response regulator
MHFEVLVLSADHSQSNAWVAALRAHGLRTKVSEAWPEAKRILLTQRASVVLHDDDGWIAPASKVLAEANAAGSPVIVLARDFDAAKWMRLFRNGAFDVLRHSAEQRHLCDSVDAALSNSRNRMSIHSSWPKAIFEWTRSRLIRNASADIVKKAVDGSRDPK